MTVCGRSWGNVSIMPCRCYSGHEQREEGNGEENGVADEDGELVRKEAEVCLDGWVFMLGARLRLGAVFLVQRVPEAEHQETRSADAHGPREGFDGNFADAAAAAGAGVAPVHDFAVIVVVAREDELDVAYFVDDLVGDLGDEDVLVLDAALDSDCVLRVVFEVFAVFGGFGGGGEPFAERAARGP